MNEYGPSSWVEVDNYAPQPNYVSFEPVGERANPQEVCAGNDAVTIAASMHTSRRRTKPAREPATNDLLHAVPAFVCEQNAR